MKVGFYTLGCKVNSYDTQAMIELFQTNGYEVVSSSGICDIYVINTCSVTNESERKSRQMVRRFKHKNEDAIIVLTGCFAQTNLENAKKIEEADIICGTHRREKIVKYVEDFIKNRKRIIEIEDGDNVFEDLEITKYENRSRAFLKVQDGCNMFCSYCIIPYARGEVRCAKVLNIIKQVNTLVNGGYKEIVLTGIHLSSYKADTGETLIDLIELIDKETNIQRIRLSSLEPNVLTESFIERLSKVKSFCPHFHISLQSGCDKILKDMNRRYTTDNYYKSVLNVRKYFENSTITTDIIVGFPGESEEEFSETVEFARKVNFSFIHIFPYSRKNGTKAALCNNQITKQIKSERAKKLKEVSKKLSDDFLESQIGKKLEILIERKLDDKTYEGYSKNYVKVIVKSDKDIFNEIIKVKIKEKEKTFLYGEII